MMDSLQIAEILKHVTRKKFKGVFASDNLPSPHSTPYCFVVNSDKQNEPGTQWMAIYVPTPNSVEFFDSFAKAPNYDINKFLSNFKWQKRNKTRVQSSADISCGPHVIYFLVNRCRGMPFDAIIHRLAKSLPFTDTLVKMFVLCILEKHI